jgi:hypothetical protein
MPLTTRTAVFVGSTYRDLIEHRLEVQETVLALGLLPIMMESFGATPDTPMNGSVRLVGMADIYVGIFAHRYGFIAAGNDISITEAEYDEATRLKLDKLCFEVDSDHPWPDEMREDEPGKSKLDAFKVNKIRNEQIVARFTTPQHLGRQVAVALFNLFNSPNSSYAIAGFAVVDATKPIRIVEDKNARVVIVLKSAADVQDKEAFLDALQNAYEQVSKA